LRIERRDEALAYHRGVLQCDSGSLFSKDREGSFYLPVLEPIEACFSSPAVMGSPRDVRAALVGLNDYSTAERQLRFTNKLPSSLMVHVDSVSPR
jgi:hypothetical protein